MSLILVTIIIFVVIFYIFSNYAKIRKMESGTDAMRKLAETISDGATTFLSTEYKYIGAVVLILALIFTLFIERTSGTTFLLGAIMSSVVCLLGMKSATHANVRTANTARETLSVGETVKVALLGGSISGLAVHAFGLLGLVTIYEVFGGIGTDAGGGGIITSLNVNPSIMRLTTYSLGCSLVAMFNRVAGGNYTKAADISSDLIAKVRHDLPEDDARVPNVVADFIGDNVNDIAGNCSDLLESFVATIVAAMMIATTMFITKTAVGIEVPEALLNASIVFPIFIAGGGLLACFVSILYVSRKQLSESPAKDLDFTTNLSAGLTIVVAFVICFLLFGNKELYPEFRCGWMSPWLAAICGIGAGVMIGKITERYTSADYGPTRKLAEMAPEGTAFVITKGDAIGSRSVLVPALVIGLVIFISGQIAGDYGIAIAALGMLSFVGTTVSIDAFGPIADNAGGIAESCHLPEEVRTITDKLDSVGNTTAAIGKGFAIGSAALATVSLIRAYVGNYTSVGAEPTLNFANFVVVAGGVIGGALIEYFSAMLTDNTIEAAKTMADMGDKMMTPEVLAGEAEPDYNKCVAQAAHGAIGYMLIPSLLAMCVPVIGGFIFGVEFVGGILVGATIVAIPRAIFNGNSGGAFDNAKKYIEAGHLEGYGKKTAAHKAAVNGDTVGDTRKDVVGVSLDIFIKMMSTVANTLAPVFIKITLFH